MSQLDELKKIIVGDNAEDVARLRERLENLNARTNDVAEILPRAIEQRIEQDEQLAKSLQKPISRSIKASIQREPKEYADILYPIMSPAIRMSIASAIRSMLATINQTVESATSFRGWRWRMEAMKTGLPYAEIALRHALLYRVEQVFLIDKESGLLISSLVNEDVVEKDSDAVSAMFTAIQSFVQDSFSGNENDQLTDMAVGEHRVWLVHGPKAMLACVIRGMAPASLRTQLIEILENIHVEYGSQLAEFQGDATDFAGVENYLEPCLTLKLKDFGGEKKQLPIGSIIGAFILLALVAYWLFSSMQQRSQLNYVSNVLGQTPGVLATDVFWQDGRLQVYGLKDPLAVLPVSRFAQQGIAEQNINFQLKPYRSLENEIVITRYREQHNVPEQVQLALDNQTLAFSGSADLSWLNTLSIEGSDVVRQFDFNNLMASEESVINYVKQSTGLAEGVVLTMRGKDLIVSGNADKVWLDSLTGLFDQNLWVKSIKPSDSVNLYQAMKIVMDQLFIFTDGTELDSDSLVLLKSTAEKIKQITTMAKTLDKKVQFGVVGFTDDVGSQDFNQQLRTERAEAVIQQLVANGVNERVLNIREESTYQLKGKQRAAKIYINTIEQ